MYYFKQQIGGSRTTGFKFAQKILLYLTAILWGSHLGAEIISCSAGFDGREFYTVTVNTDNETFYMTGMHQMFKAPISTISDPTANHYIANFGRRFLRLEQKYEGFNTLWIGDERSAVCR